MHMECISLRFRGLGKLVGALFFSFRSVGKWESC